MLKRLGCLGLVVMMMISTAFGYADNDDSSTIKEDYSLVFEDVDEEDWYYEPVMTMAQKGIIDGYDDNTFRPLAPVLREEFAKMMVLALNLEIKSPASTFVDVADGYWASRWIETARTYLTGYIRNGEYLYKPKEIAAREDMAVALVKAKELEVSDHMLSALDAYEDQGLISPNLRKYMAAAVYHEVMIGYVEDGKKYLKPKSDLTRAEAAKLILSVIKEDKKVVLEDVYALVSKGQFPLEAIRTEEGYRLSWDYQGQTEATAFNVVASQSKVSPAYPEDGYTAYVDKTTYDLKVGSSYVSGDFDGFVSGGRYYISVTANVEDSFVTSDVLSIEMPVIESKVMPKPRVSVTETDEGLLVSWDKIEHSALKGYKVVASKSVESPEYPKDGYAKEFQGNAIHDYLIKPNGSYSGGDVGGRFKSGESYYFNVVGVYTSENVAGDGVLKTMNAVEHISDLTKARTTRVDAKVQNNKILLTWSEVDKEGLQSYNIVASLGNPNPVYSQDGFAYWITSLETKEKYLAPYTSYSGGDVGGKLLPGESYYISVTSVYKDQKVPGNAILITMPNVE